MVTLASTTSPVGTGRDGDPSWPVPGLTRRLVRALEFASAAVEDFGDSGYVDAERPALSFGPEKVVAEAAMLAYAADGSAPEVQDRIAALVAQLAPRVRSTTALADMALNPDRAFKRAVPHVLLTMMGSAAPDFDDFAADRCATVLRHGADQPATVLAERRWLCSLWPRLRHDGAAVASGSALDLPADLRVQSREDAYGLTHMLFYVTDFGRRSPAAFLTRGREAVLADVEGLVARYLDHGDYDLLAELLMAWPQLRAPWSPAAAFAFRVLAQVEDEVGLLPCGNVDPVRLATLTGADRTRYARATSYHTVFVMGFLSALTLRTGPETATAATPVPGAWSRFRGLVHDDTSQWLEVLDREPPGEREALAPLVRDLVLTQALRRHDLPRAHEALTVSASLGLPSSTMERAAADRLWAIHRAMEIARA